MFFSYYSLCSPIPKYAKNLELYSLAYNYILHNLIALSSAFCREAFCYFFVRHKAAPIEKGGAAAYNEKHKAGL